MADCPNIKRFLSETVQVEDLPVLQEFVGYCLTTDCKYQKALVLQGPAFSGKSTFLILLEAFLGPDNFTCLSPRALSSTRFKLAELQGKMANIWHDLLSEDLNDYMTVSLMKLLIAGEPLMAEEKYTPPFVFINRAKMIFAASTPLNIIDEGFRRRLLFINFPNRFLGELRDPNILGRLTTKIELRGFLEWACEGLKRLEEQGFSDRKEAESIG